MALDPLLSLSSGEQNFPLSFTPDFRIVQVNANGLVVSCSRSFEWGATLQLGVLLHIQASHLDHPDYASGTPGSTAMAGDSILDFKGVVVDCQEVLSYPSANPQYVITLFYDSISEEQCAALLRASHQRQDLDTFDFGLLSFDDPEGFERVLGLN